MRDWVQSNAKRRRSAGKCNSESVGHFDAGASSKCWRRQVLFDKERTHGVKFLRMGVQELLERPFAPLDPDGSPRGCPTSLITPIVVGTIILLAGLATVAYGVKRHKA